MKQKAPYLCAALNNGGLSKTTYELILPNNQLIDTITLLSKKPIPDEIFLKEKYVKEGLSSKEIAAMTFSSRAVITKLLKKNEIPLKTVTRKNNGGHVYGYRKYGGKCIELKKEQELIRAIKARKDEGGSYIEIARWLNSKRIKTKLGKGVWHAKVVRQILLRCK